MAKSRRASSVKTNNQRFKKDVFGPVDTARAERLSSKLLELVSQPKPQAESEMKDVDESSADKNNQDDGKDEQAMDVDSGAKIGKKQAKQANPSRKIGKRRAKKSSVVFPKYGERLGSKKKR